MSVSSTAERPVTRHRRTERTRRRLLDAGRTLFAAHGPAAVTSHAIAAEAGFASGTFYLHFKHKQALFQELADEAVNELEARLAEAAAAAGGDPRALVESQAEALVGFAESHRELFRIVFRPDGESPETGARVLERLARRVRTRRREAVAHGLAWGCLDSDVMAQAVVGMWVRVLGWWVEDPRRATRADIVRTLSHFQLHGSRAPVEGAACDADGHATDRGRPIQGDRTARAQGPRRRTRSR